MKAFGYMRVSGIGQVSGDGFDRQEKSIMDYAQAHGIEIAGIYRDEGVSGTREDRPALARLMVDLEANGHGIKTVIVEKLDRLARDLMVQEVILRDFQAGGIALISAVEGDDLLADDPTRKLVRQVLGAIHEYEKQMTVLKLRAARDRKRAKEGRCEGRKPLDEVNPDLIRLIRQLRRKRPGGVRRTYEQVAQELNERGMKTSMGKNWTAANVANVMKRF